jgi:hypothetical protein
LGSDEPKTLGGLGTVFADRAFAVAILLLMFPAALPLPTGGVTHVLEIVAIIVAAEMVLGLTTIWLPTRWRNRELGGSMTGKGLPFVIRRVTWAERFSKPRGASCCSSVGSDEFSVLASSVLLSVRSLHPRFPASTPFQRSVQSPFRSESFLVICSSLA